MSGVHPNDFFPLLQVHHFWTFTITSKGGLTSETFSRCLNCPKKVPNHYPYPPKEEVHRIVIWHILLEMEPK